MTDFNFDEFKLTQEVRYQVHKTHFERAWGDLKAKPTLENLQTLKYHARFIEHPDSLYTEVCDDGTFCVSFTDENGTRIITTMEDKMTREDFEEFAKEHQVKVLAVFEDAENEVKAEPDKLKREEAIKMLVKIMNEMLSLFWSSENPSRSDGMVQIPEDAEVKIMSVDEEGMPKNMSVSAWSDIESDHEALKALMSEDYDWDWTAWIPAEDDAMMETLDGGQPETITVGGGCNDTGFTTGPAITSPVPEFLKIKAEVLKESLPVETLMPLASPFPTLPDTERFDIDAHLQD